MSVRKALDENDANLLDDNIGACVMLANTLYFNDEPGRYNTIMQNNLNLRSKVDIQEGEELFWNYGTDYNNFVTPELDTENDSESSGGSESDSDSTWAPR